MTITSGNKIQLRTLSESFAHLYYKVNKDTPEYITNHFYHLCYTPEHEFSDKRQRKKLISDGEKALEKEQYMALKTIVNHLWNLLPDNRKGSVEGKSTGIS